MTRLSRESRVISGGAACLVGWRYGGGARRGWWAQRGGSGGRGGARDGAGGSVVGRGGARRWRGHEVARQRRHDSTFARIADHLGESGVFRRAAGAAAGRRRLDGGGGGGGGGVAGPRRRGDGGGRTAAEGPRGGGGAARRWGAARDAGSHRDRRVGGLARGATVGYSGIQAKDRRSSECSHFDRSVC